MQAIEHPHGSTLIYHLAGKINGIEAILFSKTVEGYRGKNYTRIIIDMRKVTFIDSVALGGLIFLNTVMKKSGIQFLLAGSGDFLKSLFRDCCLDKVFSFVDSQEYQELFPNALNTP